MATIIVWGRGPAQSRLIRGAETTNRALAAARALGWDARPGPDEPWAVELDAKPDDVDAATRHDPAVQGWVVVQGWADVPDEAACDTAEALRRRLGE